MSNGLENAPAFAMKNRVELGESEIGGCYHCMQVFSVHDIVDWTDNDQTAICPLCEVDAVIPQSVGIDIDEENLKAIHDRWFSSPNAKDRTQT